MDKYHEINYVYIKQDTKYMQENKEGKLNSKICYDDKSCYKVV